MEPIKSLMKGLIGQQELQRRTEKIRKILIENPKIRSFMDQNPQIDQEKWTRHLPELYQFVEEWQHCAHCPGLEQCPNMMKGFRPELINDHGDPALTFKACPLLREDQNRRRQSRLIRSYYVPKEILSATFKTIDKNEVGRQEALKAAGDFVRDYLKDPETAKGLYLCGEFGVGKTYLMGAIMNSLAQKRHVASLIIYVPDFFREIKGAIQDNTVDSKLDVLKKTPVLILDDIGAETMTPWVRDEVLGSVLQYRMMEHLPTLYTSNFNYDELENHFSYSQKSGIENVKAKRVMERIRHFTKLIQMDGKNRR
ncbi:primosomal protein DnaI [Sporolactobacillus sp. THM19-2]|uniref:primosomal protein DnaI n=1 Tax=Sporolactobacillus sp. THM19-2 TaxID=2511171 RepID=UPI001020B16E|nr:primosomal protein DnaI [Sporolactobacillus sp. THM19-2]RYL94621.1 primosomal protein DnaI [Sporolactobacillus sp. THM19-2]